MVKQPQPTPGAGDRGDARNPVGESQAPRADLDVPAGVRSGTRVLTSQDVLGADGRVHIVHAGQTYTLTVTRQNKLILTK